jgi:spermidine/putrescine transport system ATP-binding protein
LTDYAVELIEVTKTFPTGKGEEIAAVDRVSLSIKPGEFFSLLGPSGCGKTTTLRMIAGFELPTQGEIRIHGESMGETPPYRRRVNTVFQNYALFPHMTVYGNVAFGLEMDKIPKPEIRERVSEALRLVRLPKMEERHPKQLSGGQQQRVALARALVNTPHVLLLDEPLGALDLKLRKAMQLELKSLQERVGITFIYVTHDQEEALTMSDRIAVMDLGHVLQVGTPGEIYENPATRFVADFIGETNLMEGQVIRRDGQTACVAVGGLEFWAYADAGIPGTGVATVAVRPEKISLSREKQPVPNSFMGTVEIVTYIGKESDYRVRLEDAAVIRVRVQNQAPGLSPVVSRGQSIWVSWPEDAARVLLD